MAGGPVDIAKKYTLRSKGIWEKIRKLLVLVPNRSTGNPLVPYYRVPSTGSRPEAKTYTDPSTIPASDIADNQYFKRDVRRSYSRLHLFGQSEIGGLLLYGSAANPRIAKGGDGQRALTTVKEGGIELTNALKAVSTDVLKGQVLDKNGLPPFGAPLRKNLSWTLLEGDESMYPGKYPVRTFK
ncbi:hypothetical protein V1511DRAFT_369069 [Dipodascopsis uninucleata]